MLRILGIFGMSAAFVAISPDLRASLGALALESQQYMAVHSPYSYGALALAATTGLTLLARSAGARR